jgi:hypothetical protein
MNKKTGEKEYWEKQEKRSWLLKIALEQSCELPAVEPQELEKIEPQIDQLMAGAGNDKETEEKVRTLIMSLYQEKQKNRVSKEAPKKEPPPRDTTPPRSPPITGRGQ